MADGRELTDDEREPLQRMLSMIGQKKRVNRLRADYHDGRKQLTTKGFSIPPHMREGWDIPLGWGEKAITVPASRIRPDGFHGIVDEELRDELADLTTDGRHETLERQWVRSAMQAGIAFAFVTANETAGEPPIRVIRPASHASAEFDARTGQVSAAVEKTGASTAILYLDGKNLKVSASRGQWVVEKEMVGVPGLVQCTPFAWSATLEHPRGRSRITRPLMGFMDIGARTLLREEVTAEYFSAPQRALMGADESAFTNAKGERISPWDAMIGGVWGIPFVWDEDEQKNLTPSLQQLQQASMQPHVDMLRSIASMVSSETTIPLGYLGVTHDQPASADAILATESDMVAMLEAELPAFGAARTDFAKKCLAVQHGEWTDELRAALRPMRAKFRDPGTPTVSARADAGQKFVNTWPEGDPEVGMELYGLDQDQRRRMLAHLQKGAAKKTVAEMLAKPAATQPAAEPESAKPEEPVSAGADGKP